MFYGNKKALSSIIKLLQAEQNDKLSHKSFLFHGPKGIGKSIVAKSFAKQLLCIGTKQQDCPCISCYHVEQDSHPDLIMIAPTKSSIKKDQVRFLKQELITSAIISRYKIIIIDDANKMTDSAQNSLLKSLEEQVGNNIFILVSHGSLLPTIESRMHKILFQSLNDEVLKLFLKDENLSSFDEEILLCASDGQIGKIVNLMGHNHYQSFTSFMKKLFSISRVTKYEILKLFGEVKEKNPNSFYQQHEDLISEFLHILNRLYTDLININLGLESYIHFKSMRSQLLAFSYPLVVLEDIQKNIIKCLEYLSNDKLTKNEFFDLIIKL